MKKLLFSLFSFSLLIFLSVSCHKESGNVSPALDVIQDDYIKFPTRMSYDSVLKNPDQITNFSNARFVSLEMASKAAKIVNDSIPKDLLQILNKDGVLQIEKWIIKLDFEKEKVYVIEESKKDLLYGKLIKQDIHPDIYTFTFENEVLSLLEEGYTSAPSKENAKIAAWCFGDGLGNDEGDLTNYGFSSCTGSVFTFTPNSARFYHTTQYHKYGVLFTLKTQIQSWITPTNLNNREFSDCLINGTFKANIFWKQKCKNPDSGTWPSNPALTYAYNLGFTAQSGNELVYLQEWTLYSRSEGLRCVTMNDFTNVSQNIPFNGPIQGGNCN